MLDEVVELKKLTGGSSCSNRTSGNLGGLLRRCEYGP